MGQLLNSWYLGVSGCLVLLSNCQGRIASQDDLLDKKLPENCLVIYRLSHATYL
jgi:hypothetical protein